MLSKILIITIVFLISIYIIIGYFDSKELVKIGKNLVMIDSITDFRTNRNHPVPKIENIGENLYQILRRNRDTQSIINIKTGDFDITNEADYIMLIHRKNFADLAIRIKKGKTDYKILGYSGGYDW
jgi:hypothetical protein